MRSRVPTYILLLLLTVGLGYWAVQAANYAAQLHYRAKAGAATYVWLNSKPTKDSPTRLQLLEKLLAEQQAK